MLAVLHGVFHGFAMHVVGKNDADGVDLGIGKAFLVILEDLAAVFLGHFGPALVVPFAAGIQLHLRDLAVVVGVMGAHLAHADDGNFDRHLMSS